MDRNYSNQKLNRDDVKLFYGREVEKTPAYAMNTLFVVGIQPILDITNAIGKLKAEHIFFGANHSFNPKTSEEWDEWEKMIQHFLKEGHLCSLDIPFSAVEEFNEGGLCEFNNFIPQIRVPVPYVKLWNYNTMIKIDDKSYNSTNPGVWCHRLHDLMDSDKFTKWKDYTLDTILK